MDPVAAQIHGHGGGSASDAAQEGRALQAAARDDLARARDRVAVARDQSAERRDRALGPLDGIDRAVAAGDRAAAGADREAAACDREHASRDRLMAQKIRDELMQQLAIAETDQLTGARTRAPGLADIDRE